MMRMFTRLVVLGVALAVVGCGGKATTPKAAFEKFVAAMQSGDEDKIVACLDKATGEAMRELLEMAKKDGKQAGMAEEMKKDVKDAKFTFSEAKIDGDKATMEVKKDGDKEAQTFQFVKEDGTWKLSIPELAEGVKAMKAMKAMAEAMGGAFGGGK